MHLTKICGQQSPKLKYNVNKIVKGASQDEAYLMMIKQMRINLQMEETFDIEYRANNRVQTNR
jgi:hypothetical protein